MTGVKKERKKEKRRKEKFLSLFLWLAKNISFSFKTPSNENHAFHLVHMFTFLSCYKTNQEKSKQQTPSLSSAIFKLLVNNLRPERAVGDQGGIIT